MLLSSGPGRRITPAFTSLRRGLAALAIVSAIACHGDGGGPAGLDPVIAGSWSGTAKAGLLRFSATFTENADSVGGSGHFSSPIASSDFSVRGLLNGTAVSLVLTSATIGETTFQGRFTAANRITGILYRPGDEDLELTLDRD